MTKGEEIRQAIRSIIAQYLITTKLREPKLCKVLSVSAGVTDGLMICDCQPLDGSAIVRDVTLTAGYPANQGGFILVPSVNSTVQVSFNDDCSAFVSMVAQVDFVYLNGNGYGGLVEVQPLVQKLNNLENAYNDLVSKFDTHIHTGGTISGSTGVPTVIDTNTLTPTQKAELENTTVQHGSGSLS